MISWLMPSAHLCPGPILYTVNAHRAQDDLQRLRKVDVHESISLALSFGLLPASPPALLKPLHIDDGQQAVHHLHHVLLVGHDCSQVFVCLRSLIYNSGIGVTHNARHAVYELLLHIVNPTQVSQ